MIYYFDTLGLNRSAGGVIQASENFLDGLMLQAPDDICPTSKLVTNFPKGIERIAGRFGVEEYISTKIPYNSNTFAIFPNYYLPYMLNSSMKKRSLCIVHDLQFLHLPQYFSTAKKFWLKHQLKRLFENAGAISFISKSSMLDFISEYGNREHLYISYNPLALRYFSHATTNPTFESERPYLLASYHYYPHKNFEGTLKLFSELKDSGYQGRLLVTGSGQQQVKAMVQERFPSLSQYVSHLGMISPEHLLNVQDGADAFISLSKFEGFNLPAAECAILGKKLILSNIPVHRELFDDYACFVDEPQDVDLVFEFITRGIQTRRWEFADICHPNSAARRALNILKEIS